MDRYWSQKGVAHYHILFVSNIKVRSGTGAKKELVRLVHDGEGLRSSSLMMDKTRDCEKSSRSRISIFNEVR